MSDSYHVSKNRADRNRTSLATPPKEFNDQRALLMSHNISLGPFNNTNAIEKQISLRRGIKRPMTGKPLEVSYKVLGEGTRAK